jgi:hypothetical protein
VTGREVHLWEIDHPYYCAEGNYFKTGQHSTWDSWQAFAEDTVFTTGDRDLNFLFRWDWRKPGHHDWVLGDAENADEQGTHDADQR